MIGALTDSLNLLYPPVCQLCQERRAEAREGFVCSQCWSHVRFIRAPFCERCGLPFEGNLTTNFVCTNCHDLELYFTSARSAVVAKTVVLEAIHHFKYSNALWFENFLADLLVREAAPMLAQVRHQVVHNDANVDNVVVDEEGWPCGILDFGDMVRTAVVADLAVAMAYAVPEDDSLDPWAAPYDLAVGFARARQLTAQEWTVLPDLVRARMAQRMLVNSWLAETNPHNAHHTLRANGHAIAALRRLAAVPAPAVPAHVEPTLEPRPDTPGA
jgi:hypothetical protein